MKVHPVAEWFPLLDEEELAALAEDIRANGLRTPITVDPSGVLLDGRNRLAACKRIGIEPTREVYDGDAVAFIIGANLHRRHLSVDQRGLIAARLATFQHGGDRRSKRPNGPLDRKSVV